MRDDLYADVLAAGGLSARITAALQTAGSPLSAQQPSVGYPYVAYLDRSVGIVQASHERLFMASFSHAKLGMATLSSPDVEMMASAIDYWIRDRAPVLAFVERYPAAEANPYASAYFDGTIVEKLWQAFEKGHRDYPELDDFLKAASVAPALRQLFPFMSHRSFCLSRCTLYPFSGDCPSVAAANPGGYVVHYPSGGRSQPVSATEAVRLVVESLPADCGPARFGTADDLTTAS